MFVFISFLIMLLTRKYSFYGDSYCLCFFAIFGKIKPEKKKKKNILMEAYNSLQTFIFKAFLCI